MQIRSAFSVAGWIELSGANAVAVTASRYRSLFTYCALFHIENNVIIKTILMQDVREISFLFSIAVLIISVVIHEVSHGYVAFVLGDKTAKEHGRLTLNPLSHLDPWGSFLVPLIVYFSSGFIFGWAKPVPFDERNLRNQKWGPAIVALAGPAVNFVIVAILGIIFRFGPSFLSLPVSFYEMILMIIIINIVLGVFNMVPIPPLDGSHVLFALLPTRWHKVELMMQSYGFLFIIIFILFFSQYLMPLAGAVLHFFTGV